MAKETIETYNSFPLNKNIPRIKKIRGLKIKKYGIRKIISLNKTPKGNLFSIENKFWVHYDINVELQKTYPKDAAIKVATQKVPVTSQTATVYKTLAMISQKSAEFDTINYIYITNTENSLIGIVSIKDLFENATEGGEKALKELMKTEIVSVRPHSSQEKAANLSLEHGIKAVPITDKEGEFLGVIPSDTILSIMHREKEEDLLKFAGISGHGKISKEGFSEDNIMKTPVFKSFLKRLPWLIVGTFGGLFMAQTISFFEATLEKNILIAAFIPLMVYASNAVGQQVTAFLIRDSAHNNKIAYFKYFLRHFLIVLLIAITIGIFLLTYGWIFYQDIKIASVLGIGVFATILSAILSGFLIPFLSIKLKRDPANVSGPIATSIQDLMSVLIYFLIANAIL